MLSGGECPELSGSPGLLFIPCAADAAHTISSTSSTGGRLVGGRRHGPDLPASRGLARLGPPAGRPEHAAPTTHPKGPIAGHPGEWPADNARPTTLLGDRLPGGSRSLAGTGCRVGTKPERRLARTGRRAWRGRHVGPGALGGRRPRSAHDRLGDRAQHARDRLSACSAAVPAPCRQDPLWLGLGGVEGACVPWPRRAMRRRGRYVDLRPAGCNGPAQAARGPDQRSWYRELLPVR